MAQDDKVNKAMVNKKISQVAEKTPEGQLGLAVIQRAVRDIGTKFADDDCWFDGSLDDFTASSGVKSGYVVRMLREYNLIPATRVAH
jgi:hypothetical protein